MFLKSDLSLSVAITSPLLIFDIPLNSFNLYLEHYTTHIKPNDYEAMLRPTFKRSIVICGCHQISLYDLKSGKSSTWLTSGPQAPVGLFSLN